MRDGSLQHAFAAMKPDNHSENGHGRPVSVSCDRLVKSDYLDSPQPTEGYLHALLRAIPDLVWLKDSNGTYLYCNSAFERYFGAREGDIIGHTDYEFVSKTVADSFRLHDQAAMAANQPTTNEEWLRFAGDSHRGLFQTIKTPMHDSTGRRVGVGGVAREITARNLAESVANQRRTWLTQGS